MMTDAHSGIIGGQTDGGQGGMADAANLLRAATDTMRLRFAGLADAARQAQAQLAAAAAQIRSAAESLQSGANAFAASAQRTAAVDRGAFSASAPVSPARSAAVGAPPEPSMPVDQIGPEGAPKSNGAAARNAARFPEQAAQAIDDAVARSLTGIVIGTTTARDALSGLLRSLLGDLVGSAVRSLFGAISGGAETGLLGGLFAGLGSIFSFSRGGIVPSAAGGWAVPTFGPGGIVARLHSHEMVLPAEISRGLQSMIAGGTPGHVFNIGVSAIDAAGVAKLFTSNGAALVSALNKALRNGSALHES